MKDNYIRFRCTDEQKAMIEASAKAYGKSVTEYLLLLAEVDSREEPAEQMLRKIGCTNQFKEIISCELIYKNMVEKSYKILTDIGEVSFRIIKLQKGTYSALDYYSTGYTFDRNVNTFFEY